MRRNVVMVMMAVLALAGAGAGVGDLTVPASAAAPAPPLDACLRSGSFNIAERICQAYSPSRGAQFGPISGIQVLPAPRGEPISLAIPGGSDVGFGPQPGEVCGEFGCIRNGTLWRVGGPFAQGLGLVSGCGGEDVTCTVVSNPPFVGDRGEIYQVVYGQVNRGINPTTASMMWALYTPPTIYPVELTPVDTSGARLALDHDVVAYAVHEGADPTAGACVEPFWYTAELSEPEPRVPDCVTFRRGGDIYSLEGTFEGWLPVDSGSWTIVAVPAGDPGAPLRSRPSGYQLTKVRPVGDDIRTSILAQRRPDLGIDIVPRSDGLALGETQVVDVTVSAVGGETGSLEAITFSDPAVLVQGSDTPPLEILGVEPAVPDGGFRLLLGESRTFAVTVRAVALGVDGIGAAVTAEDDLGTPRAAAERGVTVLVQAGALGGGPGAPEPPVVVMARAGDGTTTGSLDGTVAGAPGEEVTVSVVTAPIGGADTCLGLLEGPTVRGLGTVPVTIGTDGVGRFAMDATLAPGHHAYGVTIADAGVSAVGPCTVVSETTPSVSIADLEVTEGTKQRGATALTVELVLSSPPLEPASVRLTTTDGTAAAPDDHAALAGHVVAFAAGQRMATATVEVVPDAAAEDDETLRLTLSEPTGLQIASDTATVTIVDDDGKAATTGGMDPRGTWRFDEAAADPTVTSTLLITDFDPGTGDWRGRFVLELDPKVKFTQKAACYKGLVCTLPASGTLRRDRFTVTVTQEGRTGKLAGILVRKKGTLTGMLSGKNIAGQNVKGRVTLTEPAP